MTTASRPLPIDEYKQVVESFAQAVWETDAQGQIVADSPSWRACTGQSLEEWLAEGWVGAIHPDDQAHALNQWQEAVRQQLPVNAEFRLRSPDGGWRWTNVRATRILDADGRVRKWIGLSIDIDDKKKAEQALQRQQTRLETAFSQRTAELRSNQQLHQATLDSTLELIQVFEAVRDEAGQIVDFVWRLNNRAAEQYYGDVVGQRLLVHNPGVVQTGIFDTFKRVVETGIPDQSERHYVHEQFNGWFYQSTVKLNDGVATTTTDISQLKKAEVQIRSGHALLQSVIDSSLDIIQVFKAVRDGAGQITDFVWVINNRKAIDQNGPVIGKSLLKQNPGVMQTGIFEYMVEVAQTGVAHEHELYYAHEQFADWFYQAIVKTDDGVAMTTRNITQQKQAEQQILHLKDEIARQATDKYQALFTSIDQGFNIIELIFDDNGHVIDYWQREHNPVFTRLTGLTNAIGKRMSELVPYVEPEWHRMIETIYYTGEPIRVEYPVGALGQWFRAYMSRIGDEGSPLIACVYDDITDQKNLEERQAYLLKLSDALRPLNESTDIQATAARTLGEHLRTDRAYYAYVDEPAGAFVVGRDWHQPDLPSHARRYPLNDWPMPWLTDGKTWVVQDTATDPAMPDDQRDSYLVNDIGTVVVVPLIEEGKLVATFVTNQRAPRAWTKAELALIEETAERTWTAVERATTEEALRVAEVKYRTLFDTMEQGFGIGEMLPANESAGRPVDYRWLDVNPQFERLTGLSRADVLSHTMRQLVPGLEEHWYENFGQVAATGETVSFEAYSPVLSRWFNVYAFALGTPDTRRLAVLFSNTTDRKQAEEAMHRLEERNRIAIEAAELATWEWDLTTDQVYWNEQHFHLLGMPVQPNPLMASAFLDHLHPDDADSIREQLRVAIDQRTLYDAEFRIVRDDGVVRWMNGYGRVVAEQNQQPLRASGVMFDITERKKAEEALKEADRRKDEFLAMLAHELRNPMAIIRNGLTILDLTITEELTRSTVGMMNRQTDHLVRMVDELLDVSRISRGKIELKLERVNLVELMQQAVRSLQPLFDQQGKALHVDLPTAPVDLLGDATRLTQVVTNLLTNGLRYTGDGGSVWLRLTLQPGPDGHMQAMIQVRDNGIGLAPDQLSAIFELFVQVDNSLARSKGGLGLGLTLVRRLVDMHGGRVDAHSEGLGRGSTFTVQLPTLVVGKKGNPEPLPTTPAKTELTRILVIDDNPDAATTIGMLLKLKGYEAHTRNSGQAGLEAAEQLRPAVILLDIGMPGLDGYATCRLIRQQPWGQAVRLIALTGYGQADDLQRTRDAGFDDHLVKPVELTALLDRLNRWLAPDARTPRPD